MATTPSPVTNVPTQPLGQSAVRPEKAPAAAAAKSGSSSAPSPAQATPAATAQSTVRISTAGLAALREARETPAQTASEARQGDRAAKAIVAREQAHLASYKATAK